MLVLNVFLAVVWAMLTGEVNATNLLNGFGVGFVLLWISNAPFGRTQYFRKVLRLIGFVLFFLWELLQANLRVAFDIVTPRHRMRPAVVAVPVPSPSDTAITLLANLLTLTPGSLSLDVSTDRRVLYVHNMYCTDLDSTRRNLADGFGRRVREALE